MKREVLKGCVILLLLIIKYYCDQKLKFQCLSFSKIFTRAGCFSLIIGLRERERESIERNRKRER